MKSILTGKALTYGDNINTDIISPPQYMELPIESAAQYTMRAIDPDFCEKVTPETILVAGNNFGSGSSRETSPQVLKYLGIRALVAKSFARIFYRNAINLGLLAIECPDTDRIHDGDSIELNVYEGTVRNVTRCETYRCGKLPEHILRLVEAGGLFESLLRAAKEESCGAKNGRV